MERNPLIKNKEKNNNFQKDTMKIKVNLKEHYRCMCAYIGWALTTSIIVSMIALTVKCIRVMFTNGLGL